MALKKSELYSSLWSSCDELRSGMDASQYKDYVLVMLFIKYVSDKYAGTPYAPITVPEGSSFRDMVALKGKSDIGDQINKKIVGPLAAANKLSDMPDFDDPPKLGDGKEKVDRLTNLIAIFENRALDFSKNRAEGDDILGDAYEYVRDQIVSKASYTTRALTNGRILAAVVLPVPELEEQSTIATILSDMDAEIAALETKLTKARQLQQGMMQELLTGRIRLV